MFSTERVVRDLEEFKKKINTENSGGKEALEQLENLICYVKTLKQSPEEIVDSIDSLYDLEEQFRDLKKELNNRIEKEKMEVIVFTVTNKKKNQEDVFYLKNKTESELFLRQQMKELSFEDFESTNFISKAKFVLESEYNKIEFVEI
jgi:hypothetical protein